MRNNQKEKEVIIGRGKVNKNSSILNTTKHIKIFLALTVLFIAGCKKENIAEGTGVEVSKRDPVTGIRIGWDYSTLKRVSAQDGTGYSGYARVVELQDRSLACVYEADGKIVIVKSIDKGASWSEPITIADQEEGINMAVPDILELNDQSLLVCYNPRPHAIDPSRRFGIRTKKSYDGGLTWKEERVVYQAGHQFENGCWEPSAIQLPNGEIQLFFANEGIYTTSSEQNISLVRSQDNGLTWTTDPEIVSFRPNARDGMPSPLLLSNGEDIVVAIEDNGFTNFKPYVLHGSLGDDWSNIIEASSSKRQYALSNRIADEIYAGAPYIAQLKTGETILSYQGTEGRPNNMNTADMKVVIGTGEATDFDRKTTPFVIPQNRSCLWNSIAVLEDNTIVALASTNAFSEGNRTEIWMIKGYVIPELEAQQKTIIIDGKLEEAIWEADFPVFIGHHGPTQIRANVAYDEQYLYVLSSIKDGKVINDDARPETSDGLTVYLDAGNRAYEAPDKGVFKILLTADNKCIVSEGKGRKWTAIENAAIRFESKITASGYVQELAIPWTLLGADPLTNTRMGFNMQLTENSGNASLNYKENISFNKEEQPYTWSTLILK